MFWPRKIWQPWAPLLVCSFMFSPVWKFARQLSNKCPTSVQQVSGNCPTTVQQLSGNCPATVRQVSDKCLTTVRQLSNKCPTTVQQVSNNCPTTVQQLSDNCPTSVWQVDSFFIFLLFLILIFSLICTPPSDAQIYFFGAEIEIRFFISLQRSPRALCNVALSLLGSIWVLRSNPAWYG
jgi:hypothetical protein